jgi:hypothetical protein
MTDDQQTDEIDIPAGYVPESELLALRQELGKTKRLLNQKPKGPDPSALMEDPEFVRGVFDKHGVPYDDEGRFKAAQDAQSTAASEEAYKARLAKAQEQWKAKELAPLSERAQRLESELGEMRVRTLHQRLESGGRRSGIVDDKFKPLPFSSKKNFAPIHAAADLFRWDDEAGDHILFDGENPVYDSKGGPVTPDAYWDVFRETAPAEVQREWFGDNRQRGSGFQNKGNAGRNAYTLTSEEARDTSKFRAAKAAAKAAGRDVVII